MLVSRLVFVALGLAGILMSNSLDAQQKADFPQTVAEESDFKATSTSAQVVDFVDRCADHASHVQAFNFGKTVEGRDLIGAIVARDDYKLGQQDERAIALVIGNIHSGECAGKEALLMLLRELAADPNHPWLQNMVVILAPNYNADANDRMGKGNRPGQLGPEMGMGRRENAQDLDLNRDFVKLESPEARALIKLIDVVNPHLFIDCHTTNGSKHQYALTYDIPHNPATASPIRDFLRQKMMPTVTEQLATKNVKTFYYGNFNRAHTSWTTYGHEPRYSTEYVGLRGRLAILSEAYSYISYRDRIMASKDFVSTCLEYVHQHCDTVRQLLDSVDRDLVRVAQTQPSRVNVSLNARAEKFDQKFVLKGYRDGKPHDYSCDFVGKYVSTRSVPLPYAYLIPAQFSRPVDRLLMHGIRIEQLTEDTTCTVSSDTIRALNRNERAFQKHKMMQVESQRSSASRQIPAGTYVVRTAQPLGRLAAYLLECESDDGLVFWNFFDDALRVDAESPIQRLDQVTTLSTQPVAEVSKTIKISLDMFDGPQSLLAAPPRPRWQSGNQIKMELYGRQFLMDAESLSFRKALDPAFDAEELRELLLTEGIEDEQAKELSALTPLESDDRNVLVFDGDKFDFVFVPNTKKLCFIGSADTDAEWITFSPDQTKLAYVTPLGLHVLDLQNFQSATYSPEKPDSQLLGKLDWVYQEELYGRGNYKGYWWSPDSKHLAFLKLDESSVHKFTITDHIPIRGEDEILSYPKAGDPNPTVQVGMCRADLSDDISWVDLGQYSDEEILVSNVSWRPDGSQVILQIQNRQQTYLDLVAVDAMGNRPQTLFQDRTPAWIESPGEPKWLEDGSFLWLSPRDGYRHLYHFEADGSQRAQLTTGKWEIRSLIEFDALRGRVYLSAAKENPRDVDGYCLTLADGNLQRLTSGSGNHRLTFSEDHSFFIDAVSTAVRPTTYRLCQNDGTFLRTLSAPSDDRWEYLDVSEPEFFTIPATNGAQLDAMIIRPPNFDPQKKYPVLMHVYAGPQAPRVTSRFGGGWYLWHQMLAQKGYVIFKCDNQSASYRGAKQAWPIHEDLGRNELLDIEQGIAWLKRQPWADGQRLGIWGWSYGGYMTAYAMTHSQSFKLGISGAPVTDWRNYDSIYTERLMGLPSENEAGYDASSVVKAAGQLSGKLLLIHGTIDDNVHLSNTMQLVFELQKAGKQFDLMIYPKNRHSVRRDDQARHLRQLMMDFVIDHL